MNYNPLSREFLLRRGFCCNNNCKNCPYKKMKMTNEQLHTEILELKQDVREIKKRLLDPDDGVVARINWNTSFRKSARIWLGVFFTSLIGIVTKMLFGDG